MSRIKHTIAIASGKGGVGKSTVTANLALALAREHRVGILDADIYGPSQPLMLGVDGKPELNDQDKMQPLKAHGVQLMSIAFLVDSDAAMIWRGPMASKALMQLLNGSDWGELDYLLIDLPPGTGDIQLTMAQKMAVNGAVLVTTPQDLALLDVRRAYAMFEKVNVPVLGVVENMSTHVCSACGHEDAIFGEAGAAQLAEQYNIPLLGQLPLNQQIRSDVDQGCPTVVAAPSSALAHAYLDIAKQLPARLSLQKKNYAHIMPKVVVERKTD